MAKIHGNLQYAINNKVTADGNSHVVAEVFENANAPSGRPVYLNVHWNSAKSSAGNETYKINFQHANTSDFTGATLKTQSAIIDIPRATANGAVSWLIPPDLGKYTRLQFDVGGTGPSIVLNAWASLDNVDVGTAIPNQTLAGRKGNFARKV